MNEARLAEHYPAEHERRRNVLTDLQVRLLFNRIQVWSNGCWTFTGSLSDGYGSVRMSNRTHRVHRLVWRLLVGELRRHIMLDHLCRNRACCNPDHLEPVEQAVNDQRGKLAKQTHCRRGGHEYTPQNTLIINGRRACRACRSARRAPRTEAA